METYNNAAVSGVGSKLIVMSREDGGEPCGVHSGAQMGSEDRWLNNTSLLDGRSLRTYMT